MSKAHKTHGKNQPTEPSNARLGVLALLGAVAAGWSAFLWLELVKARTSGADPFCAFGESDCGALWDAGFAAAVHRFTGVPVAGWGVVWGVAALLLPVIVMGRRSGWPKHLAGVKLLGVLGLLSVVGLLAASAAAGLFCSSCAVVYGVAGLYGLIALTEKAAGPSSKGLAPVATALVGVFLVLLFPGLQTPKSAVEQEQEALAAAAEGAAEPADPVPSTDAPLGMPERFTSGGGTGDPARDAQLRRVISTLAPNMRQGLSNALKAYADSPVRPAETPRFLDGSPTAPTRIVEFTDTLCSHCASLHQTLEYLKGVVEEGSFSVESRQYPLDGNCNADLTARGPESVRCLAAKTKICLEGEPGYQEVTEELYRRQRTLTPADVYEAAAPYISRAELDACVSSSETAAELASDVEYAARFSPKGTPLVLVNGREGTPFAPFLYAMVLTGGSYSHPAFAALPKPNL